MGIIRQVVESIINHTREFNLNNPYASKLTLVIYMRVDFWRECQSQMIGGLTSSEWEFISHRTIHGYKVFVIADDNHPPFIVYRVNNEL